MTDVVVGCQLPMRWTWRRRRGCRSEALVFTQSLITDNRGQLRQGIVENYGTELRRLDVMPPFGDPPPSVTLCRRSTREEPPDRQR